MGSSTLPAALHQLGSGVCKGQGEQAPRVLGVLIPTWQSGPVSGQQVTRQVPVSQRFQIPGLSYRPMSWRLRGAARAPAGTLTSHCVAFHLPLASPT